MNRILYRIAILASKTAKKPRKMARLVDVPLACHADVREH